MVQANVSTMGDDQLAGALYAVVLRLSRWPVDAPVDKAGLAVLHELRSLGTVRPSDLASQMRLDLSTISRHLRSLEQQGMVRRTADPDDARAQHVTITTRGSDVLSRVLKQRAATIDDAIVDWPEGDRHALDLLLRRLADDLSDPAEPAARVAPAIPQTSEEPGAAAASTRARTEGMLA